MSNHDSEKNTSAKAASVNSSVNSDELTPEELNEDREHEVNFTNLPNMLTLSRMLFVPLVVGCLFFRTSVWDQVAGWLFTVAAITDYFDGYYARTRNLVSVYGKLMDPLADKFLVVSSLVMLQYLGRISPIVVMLLICRELAITALRALASAEGFAIGGASQSAKWKTATQMVAIPWLMAKEGVFGIPVYRVGHALLYISLAISLWSAKDYVVDFFGAVKAKSKIKAEARRQKRLARKKK